MIEVELPDGSVAEFPDGTSNEAIQGALRKRFAAPDATTNPLEQVYADYPGLRKYGFQFRDSPTPSTDGRKLEFYPPGESESPFPDKTKPGIERFDPSMGKGDILGDMMHFLPGADKNIGALRQQFQQSISPEQQDKWLRGDYQAQVKSGVFRDNVPSYEQWLQKQGGDAFFRGYLSNQYPREAYTPEQAKIFDQLSGYLKDSGSAPQMGGGLGAPEAPSISGLARFGRGLMDIPRAGSQLWMHALPESVVNKGNEIIGKANELPVIGPLTKWAGVVPESTQQYDARLTREEQAYQGARRAGTDRSLEDVIAGRQGDPGMDWMRLGGNIAATAPLAMAAPAATGGLGAQTLNAAVQGGALGALQPVYGAEEGGFAGAKAKQAGLGAATSAALTPLTYGLSRVVSPKTSPDVQTLLDAGVTPTPGQILGGSAARTEEKLTSIPLLGDAIKSGQRRAINEFNQAAYQRALDPIGQQAGKEVGREGVQAVKDALGQAYDNLLPNLKFMPDAQFAQDLNTLRSMAQNMPEPQAARFEKILNDKLLARVSPNGGMAGETYKGVESELSRLAKGYLGDASFDNRELGAALEETLKSLRGTLQRSNPTYAKDLAAINLGYANYARIRGAASGVGAAEGIFTPAQLQSAVRAADKSVGKGQFATGNALMQDLSEAGKNVLSQKYPDSGTPGRMLMGMAGAGGLGAINPGIPAAGGLGALMYTPAGQRAMAALLARRPAIAGPAAQMLQRSAPGISAAGAVAAPQIFNQ